MDDKTTRSRAHYNSIADGYGNSREGRFTYPYNQEICRRVQLHDGDTVLDVACGNGRLLSMLSKKAGINAYGIDVSEEMIHAAEQHNPHAVFNVCPADNTGYEGNTFDLITVCCAFHHFTKPTAFMKEAHRILKPGGKLLIADPLPSAFIRALENLIIPLMGMGDVKLYSAGELEGFFEETGFRDIKVSAEDGRVFVEGIK